MKSRCFFRCTLAPVTCLIALITVGSLSADTLYWDTDGATAGSAATSTAIWGITDAWSADPTGSTATSAYVAASDVVVSAGTNATGAFTLKVNGNHTANSLTFQEGIVTISATDAGGTQTTNAGSLTIGAGGISLTEGLNGTATIGASLGNLVLSSSQTWTNSTTTNTTTGTTARRLTVAAGVIGNATTGNTTTLTSTGITTGSGSTAISNVNEIQGIIGNGSGGGELAITKSGNGILLLSGSAANTYTGLTKVTGGTLSLGKTSGINAVVGSISVTGGTLSLNTSNQIANTSAITGTGGNVTMNGRSETFASLALSSTGKFQTGNTGGTSAASTVTISGAVTLASTTSSQITVNSGGILAVNSLSVSGTNVAIGTGGNVLIGGNHDTIVTSLNIGSGGLTMAGQTIQINAIGVAGARINLGGDFTANGALNNTIGLNLVGTGNLSTVNELALGTGTRTFTVNSTGTTTLGLKTTGENLIKEGTGVLVLSAANTYNGSTTVSGGKLTVSGSINTTTALGISNGTFALGASNAVNDAATVSLGTGATIQMAGFSETFAALGVSGNNALLDLTGGDSLVNFANSSSSDWTGGLLTISGWSGLLTGGGSEQVVFTSAGLTTGQLSQIQFLNPTGLDAGTYSAKFIGSEIVPFAVPEPSALLLTALGSLALLRRKRRALQKPQHNMLRTRFLAHGRARSTLWNQGF